MPNAQASFIPQPVPTGNAVDCKLGRRSIHVTIDFSLGATFSLDLSQIQNSGAMDSVQTLYVDNSGNAGDLNLTMGLTQQTITLPAGAQAYLPILQGNPPVLSINAPVGTPIVNVWLLNFFLPPQIWYTAGFPVVDLTLESVITNGGVNVNASPITVTGPTDASGVITAGGTRQALFATNSTRKRWTLSNPSTASEVLQFSFVSNTGGLIDLPPGTTWNEADFTVSGDEVWIVGATTGHAFTAYSWG